jgi:small subunit ribosomal protein S18
MSKKFKLRVSTRLVNKKMRKQSFFSKKHCKFCSNSEFAQQLDYKNIDFLKGFLTERHKILPSRVSGNCFFHQRILARQIKIARLMALVHYCAISHM